MGIQQKHIDRESHLIHSFYAGFLFEFYQTGCMYFPLSLFCIFTSHKNKEQCVSQWLKVHSGMLQSCSVSSTVTKLKQDIG